MQSSCSAASLNRGGWKATTAAAAAGLSPAIPGIAVSEVVVIAVILALGDDLNKQQERRLLEVLKAAAEQPG